MQPRIKGRFGTVSEEERFWSKVELDEECWIWTAYTCRQGYGRFHSGSSTLAHRFAYELLIGSIPEGMQLDHLCRNSSCVNPGHLEPVTNAENVRRGLSGDLRVLRKYCMKGLHEMTPDNLYTKISAKGRPWRTCKACNLGYARTRYYSLQQDTSKGELE